MSKIQNKVTIEQLRPGNYFKICDIFSPMTGKFGMIAKDENKEVVVILPELHTYPKENPRISNTLVERVGFSTKPLRDYSQEVDRGYRPDW